MPPETLGSYVKVLHEINRAVFFGTCPNYLANLEIEKARMETDNPTWATNPGLVNLLQNHKGANKYGKKKGSPNSEE